MSNYKVEYYLNGKYINNSFFDKKGAARDSITDWFNNWAATNREAVLYQWNADQEKYYKIDFQSFIYALPSFYCNKCKDPGFSNYRSPPYPNKCCNCN